MSCCGKDKKQKPKPNPPIDTSFVLNMSNGNTQTFGSRLEAHAALVRSGGRGKIVRSV